MLLFGCFIQTYLSINSVNPVLFVPNKPQIGGYRFEPYATRDHHVYYVAYDRINLPQTFRTLTYSFIPLIV
jgi:hypothetical protein